MNFFKKLFRKYEIISDDDNKYIKWLKKNAGERMDANRKDLFKPDRCDFHLDRYNFASNYVKSDMILLDVASGTGYGSNLLKSKEKSISIVGVEIDKNACEYANHTYGEKNNIKYLEGSILELPFEDNHFDIVTSFETIEHVEDDRGQIKEVLRVLKPNGLYIVSTPNAWSDHLFGKTKYHVRDYNYEQITNLLSEYCSVLECHNQNSGSITPFNHKQKKGIVKTSDENKKLAECFILVCQKLK